MDDDEDTFRVSLTRNEQFGFGFSLLGVSGLPHVIFDIVESSPAELEEVSAVKSGSSVGAIGITVPIIVAFGL